MEIFTSEKHLSVTLGQCTILERRPIYCGNVTLIVRDNSCHRRVAVFMKLYERCPKHYAVLYRGEDCEFRYGLFHYGKCSVKNVPENKCQFDISQTEEGIGLRFEAPCVETAEKWMESFRCISYCSHSPRNRRNYRAFAQAPNRTQMKQDTNVASLAEIVPLTDAGAIKLSYRQTFWDK